MSALWRNRERNGIPALLALIEVQDDKKIKKNSLDSRSCGAADRNLQHPAFSTGREIPLAARRGKDDRI